MATGGGNVSDVCLDKYTHIQAPDLSKVTEKESICLSEFQEAAQRLEVRFAEELALLHVLEEFLQHRAEEGLRQAEFLLL